MNRGSRACRGYREGVAAVAATNFLWGLYTGRGHYDNEENRGRKRELLSIMSSYTLNNMVEYENKISKKQVKYKGGVKWMMKSR